MDAFSPFFALLQVFARQHRALLKAGTVALALFLVIVIEWPIPGAAPMAERVAMSAGADACTVKGVRASLAGGVSFDGLSVTLPVEGSLRLVADLPSLHARYRPIYTLTHWSALMESIASPDTTKPASPSSAKKARDRRPALKRMLQNLDPFCICVRALSCTGGRISLKGFGPWTVTCNRPDIHLKLRFGNGFSIKGKVGAASAGIDDILCLKPIFNVASSDSIIQIDKIRARFFEGRAEGKLNFDLAGMRIAGGAFEVHKVDIARLYRAAALGGTIGGHADARVVIDTSGLSWPAIRARLDLSLKGVYAKNIPVVENLFILGELSGLTVMRFSAIEVGGSLKKGWVEVDTIRGKGVPLCLEASGRLRPADGYFRFGVKGLFEPSYKDSVSTLVWDAMIPEAEGARSVKGILSGTFTSPSLIIDRNITRRAVKNVFGGTRKGVRSIFD